MSHATMQEWQLYAAGTLSLARSEELDQHLYACEECLAIYMDVIDMITAVDHQVTPPVFAEEKKGDFADRVMSAIHEAASLETFETFEAFEAFEAVSNENGNTQKIHLEKQTELDTVQIDTTRVIKPHLVVVAPSSRNGVSRSRMPLICKPLFQYTVAAVVTLILVASGVFQDVGAYAGRAEPIDLTSANGAISTESFSQRLMEKTTSLLDTLHPTRIGGHPHE
ncbi:hypothetical protein Back11_40110 [Paenibacillus baekrokdamisoli]|uniref:Uncharacterized protein n=1 Tax=Paenibacillus baekrokdamisoli TaxID=1712516 RepID=A0A3G9IVY8_9BACL|nr:hypothetical protein [Paenibacillus baekrokdamisoli]MBB3068292.1 hypothetical protein [Paenibacillus baekrokdamisoli]BBH22666.1 hypothetical protein Back11_40110 [Paenibacillus baekrokdamisoli]